jgi:uncharacterized membrane protein
MSAVESLAARVRRIARAVADAWRRAVPRLLVVERLLPAIFAAYAIPLALFFACVLPAMRAPDEYLHFVRAEQISSARLLTWKQDAVGGGIGDGNIGELDRIMNNRSWWDTLAFRARSGRIEPAQLSAAEAFTWGCEQSFVNLYGVAPYGPVLYLPAAVSVTAGKALGLSIHATLILTRLVNAAIAIAIAVIALMMLPFARAAMFTVLLLPMAVHQIASASQDSMLISLSALFAAMAARALHQNRALGRGELIALAGMIAAVAMARPPMLAAVLVLLIPGLAGARNWFRNGLFTAAAVSLIAFSWTAYAVEHAGAATGHLYIPVYPMQQVALLLDRPLHFFTLIAETWRFCGENLTRHFVGELGWFEVLLPTRYYAFMLGILACALAAAFLERKAAGWRASIVIGCAVAAGVFGILLALYVSWTPLGWNYIEGPQGRYFLPLALLLCAGLPAIGSGPALRGGLTCIVAAAPLVTLAVVPWAVIARYYCPPG